MKKVSLRQRIGEYLIRSNVGDASSWLTNIVSRNTPASGANVNSDSALKVSAVYACVKVISEAIASLPLMLYERVGEGKKPATGHYLFPLLHNAPNSYMTSFEWRECLMAHELLRGNSYHLKRETPTGKIVELIPLNPAKMEPEVIKGKIFYNYKWEDAKQEVFPQEKIWHVKNMPITHSYSGDMPEGVVGLSPISVAKESIGMAMSADEYGGRYFSNNASIGLALKFPQGSRLTDQAKAYLEASLASYGKIENKFKSIILEDGADLAKIGMSNEDSQFLQSRQFQVEDIARIYRVPPVLIGHPTNTMTYASAEQLFLSFATYTIRPWCVRLEQSMNRYLLSQKDQGRYFFEFKMDGLLRGDLAGRYSAYSQARQWGWMNVDEIRALENMNPLPDGKGEIYMQPLNMSELGKEPVKQPVEENQNVEEN